MSEESKFYLMLPLLVEEGLIEDDSNDYSSTSYPREVISQAAITVVSDFANRLDSIDTSSMKRIDTALEYMAVALSLPMKHTDLMITCRVILRKWLENTPMFGDLDAQNLYARRIIKHLSLIFALREPEEEIFKTSFNTLASTVLSDIKYFHTTHGQWLSHETWTTIMNVLIGICDTLLTYDFQSMLPKPDAAKLRQKAVDTYFSAIQLSGIRDKEVWDLFAKYCRKWTKYFDFIRIWGRFVSKFFVYLNLRIYKPGFEPQQQPFKEGVYSPTNQISTDMVGFIFYHFVFAIDHNKLTDGAPELLKEFASNMYQVTMSAQVLGDVTSSFFIRRFSGISFLKIFGSLFTFTPILSANYDEPVSTMVNSIISILSNFQFEKDDPSVMRLLSYIIRRSTPEHMPPLAMFLNSAFMLYQNNTVILPFVSDYSLTMMPQLNPAKATRIINDAFFQTCTSLFISATETLIHQDGIVPKYQAAFEMLWKNTTRSDVQFQLLAFASKLEINVFEKISLFFVQSTFRQMTTDSLNIPFICALIYLLCAIIRNDPKKASEQIINYKLFQKIISDVTTTDSNRLENFEQLICAVLQFVVTTIEWGVDIFTSKEILAVVFQFIEYVRSALHSYKKSKKDKEKEKESCKWVENYFEFIRSSLEDIVGRICIHLPSKDFFTRRTNSYLEINEDEVAKFVGLKEERSTRFFSVQHHILISAIENDDGTGPLVLMSRGPHGKAIYVVNENLRLGSEDPQLSTEIQPEKLEPVETFKTNDPSITEVDDLKIGQTIKDIDEDDKAMRTVFASSFNEWLDISKLHYVPSLTENQPPKRPHVVDFITEMGYCIGDDTYSLRTFDNLVAVREAIRQIDLADTAFFTPVVITHVLQTDTSLDINDGYKRMTPLMSRFLHEIAEPMQISDAVCESSGIPLLKTAVPCIPIARGQIAFISEALAKNEIEATKFNELEPYVKIIFNETDYALKINYDKNPTNLLLVIKPKGDGLYHVKQVQIPENMYSSFSSEQVLTANAIAFNITCCIEQLSHTQNKLYPKSAHQKDRIIHMLETKFGTKPTLLTVGHDFK